MPKRIYVGNLPGTITRSQVTELFAKYGTVTSVEFARDNTVSVEMASGADEAMKALHQKDMGGMVINVSTVPLRR